MPADRTARRMAAALSSGLDAQFERGGLVEPASRGPGPEGRRARLFAALNAAERDEAARRVAEIEASLRAVYAADPVASRLISELASRLREPADLLFRAIAAACAPERFREELVREDLAEHISHRETLDELVRAIAAPALRTGLEAVLRAIGGHAAAATAARRALEQVRAASPDVDEPTASPARPKPEEPDEDLVSELAPIGNAYAGSLDPYGALEP